MSASGFPSGNHVRRERIVHGRSTRVHQQGEGGKAFGKIAHCLGRFLPVCLRCILVCCGGVQYTDDGSKHRQGVSAEVDGEKVLSRG